MKTLECQSCGGSVIPSFYGEPKGERRSDQPKRVFYECPLCGPGVHDGPEEGSPLPGFPAPAVTA